MNTTAHKIEGANRIQKMRFNPFISLPERMRTACDRSGANGNAPRKGKQIPLNKIKYSEQRDALRLNPQSGGLCRARLTSPQDLLTGYGYFGARYMDHELMTMWLSVDPLADKYPSISPYAYCAWNPVKLVDPEGKEAMENEDWYRNDVGDILWDDKVKRQEDLPDNYTYLGSNGVGVNEEGFVTRVYNEDGTIDVIPQYLPQVDIVANSRSTEVATQMPIALSVALWDGPEIGPTDVVAALSLIYLAGCYTFWKVSEIIAAPGDGSCPNQDIRGGHDNNVRKSTKGKHENGDSRRLQDQQGSKGEKMMKGKRPKGYKGPWPPKKKK